jgi:phytoene synthase
VGGLDTLVDATEAMLLAEDEAGRRDAAQGFGEALFVLSGGGDGSRWGLLWGAILQEGEAEARRLLADARGRPAASRASFAGNKALLMLDRWAGAIVSRDGDREWRSEGLLLLRIGLIGR